MKSIKSFLQWILWLCGCFLLLIAAIRIYEEIRYGHLTPPGQVRTIEDFREWNPSFTNAERVIFRGSTNYAVTGPHARFKASGLSEYYFDSNGHYIGWNRDVGDFYEPAIFFTSETRRQRIPIGEIPDSTRTPKSESPKAENSPESDGRNG